MLLLLFYLFFRYHNYIDFMFWFNWLSINLKIFLPQFFLLYFTIKMFLKKNNYYFLGYNFLWIFMLFVFLSICQLSLFGLIILITESIVLFFILFIFIHTNVTNLYNKEYKNIPFYIIWFICTILIFFESYDLNYYNYYITWYSTSNSFYNDFIYLYTILYKFDSLILIFSGIFLLLLTFFLILNAFLCLKSLYYKNLLKKKSVNYFDKNQSIWYQLQEIFKGKFFK